MKKLILPIILGLSLTASQQTEAISWKKLGWGTGAALGITGSMTTFAFAAMHFLWEGHKKLHLTSEVAFLSLCLMTSGSLMGAGLYCFKKSTEPEPRAGA